MQVLRIALGVFLGNVMFGLLTWLLFGFAMASLRESLTEPVAISATVSNADAQADKLEAQADRLEAMARQTEQQRR